MMAYNPCVPYYPNYYYCYPPSPPPCYRAVTPPRPPLEVASPSLVRGLASCMQGIDGASFRQSQFRNHVLTNVTQNVDTFARGMPRVPGRNSLAKSKVAVKSPALDLSTLTRDAEDILGPLVHLCNQGTRKSPISSTINPFLVPN